jgi:hypothetical protein
VLKALLLCAKWLEAQIRNVRGTKRKKLKLALRAQAKWKRLDGLKTWRAHSPTAVKTNTTRGIALMHECRVF